MRFCIYGAASNKIDKEYILAGEKLGKAMAEAGHGMVFGGGASGLMGAAARGMTAGGAAEIIGIAPSFFDVDGVLYPGCTEMIYTETMSERKHRMEEMADGFIITPGGVGTMDEFFETLTLKSLGLHDKPIGVLNVDHFYDDLNSLIEKMAEGNFLRQGIQDMFFIGEDPEELIREMEKQSRITFPKPEFRY